MAACRCAVPHIHAERPAVWQSTCVPPHNMPCIAPCQLPICHWPSSTASKVCTTCGFSRVLRLAAWGARFGCAAMRPWSLCTSVHRATGAVNAVTAEAPPLFLSCTVRGFQRNGGPELAQRYSDPGRVPLHAATGPDDGGPECSQQPSVPASHAGDASGHVQPSAHAAHAGSEGAPPNPPSFFRSRNSWGAACPPSGGLVLQGREEMWLSRVTSQNSPGSIALLEGNVPLMPPPRLTAWWQCSEPMFRTVGRARRAAAAADRCGCPRLQGDEMLQRIEELKVRLFPALQHPALHGLVGDSEIADISRTSVILIRKVVETSPPKVTKTPTGRTWNIEDLCRPCQVSADALAFAACGITAPGPLFQSARQE